MHRSAAIAAIHRSPAMAVIAVTGGGVGLVRDLLVVPGASATILEAVIPYAAAALDEWVGEPVSRATSAATAVRMAEAARARARSLAPRGSGAPLIGLGVTAALVSDRPKRGAHRAHIAAVGGLLAATTLWSLTLAKGARDREGEDRVVSDLGLGLLAQACGLEGDVELSLVPGDELRR